YAINGVLSGAPGTGVAAASMAGDVLDPAGTILFAEDARTLARTAAGSGNLLGNGGGGGNNARVLTPSNHNAVSQIGNLPIDTPTRHTATWNYAFADGHVQRLSP